MMTKPAVVVPNKVLEKRKKWNIYQELQDRNDNLDEALCILDSLKALIFELPDTLNCGRAQAESIAESVTVLDASLDKCMETTTVHFEEIEGKLDEIQKSLLHDDAVDMHRFSKLVSEVRCSQKLMDTLIGNAEEEIYRFLENEGLYLERQKTDARIMELILNF